MIDKNIKRFCEVILEINLIKKEQTFMMVDIHLKSFRKFKINYLYL